MTVISKPGRVKTFLKPLWDSFVTLWSPKKSEKHLGSINKGDYMKGVYAPYIEVKEEEVYILGEPAGLIALGEMLILKGKLGKNLAATFHDGINKPIRLECAEDLTDSVEKS